MDVFILTLICSLAACLVVGVVQDAFPTTSRSNIESKFSVVCILIC